MSTRHTLKCWPQNFQATWDGVQTYTVRKNDRNFKVGDSLQIEEFQKREDMVHDEQTGRVMGATITHITPGGDLGLPSDICVLGITVWERNLFPDSPIKSLT